MTERTNPKMSFTMEGGADLVNLFTMVKIIPRIFLIFFCFFVFFNLSFYPLIITLGGPYPIRVPFDLAYVTVNGNTPPLVKFVSWYCWLYNCVVEYMMQHHRTNFRGYISFHSDGFWLDDSIPAIDCMSKCIFWRLNFRHLLQSIPRLKKSWALNRTRVPMDEILRSEISTIWASWSRLLKFFMQKSKREKITFEVRLSLTIEFQNLK